LRIYRIRKFPTRLILIILTISIIVFNSGARSGLKGFLFGVLSKPFMALSRVKGYFARSRELTDENLLLKQRNALLSLTLAKMRELETENKRLRSLVGFKKKLSAGGIAARVIGRGSTDWHKTIIIDKGKKHGIRERMPCATAKGLIGSVAEVGPVSSKVMLITDPNSRVGVVLQSSRESGVLIGFPEGKCKVIYLSLDGDIKDGERVLTAGFSAFFPKALPVGRVVNIAVGKSKLDRYAHVEPFENMNAIEEIICIDAKDAEGENQ